MVGDAGFEPARPHFRGMYTNSITLSWRCQSIIEKPPQEVKHCGGFCRIRRAMPYMGCPAHVVPYYQIRIGMTIHCAES